jgi:hypothetical protein
MYKMHNYIKTVMLILFKFIHYDWFLAEFVYKSLGVQNNSGVRCICFLVMAVMWRCRCVILDVLIKYLLCIICMLYCHNSGNNCNFLLRGVCVYCCVISVLCLSYVCIVMVYKIM